MRKLLTLVLGLLLPGVALAQPVCSPTAPNAPQCYPQAVSPAATDVVLGVQATGPARPDQTVKFSLSQLIAAGLPGSFSTLSASGTLAVTGAATLGFGSAAPLTFSSGSIAVASGQNLTISMGGSTKTLTLAGTGGTGSVFVATAAAAPTRQIDFSATAVTGGTLVKSVRNFITGPFAQSGVYSTSTSPLAISGAASGTVTAGAGGDYHLMQWALAGDSMAVGTANFTQFIDIQHNWGGGTGGRQTFNVHLNQLTQSANSTADVYYQPFNIASDVKFNEGGSGLTVAAAKGHNFAGSSYTRMYCPGAAPNCSTNWFANVGWEWDILAETGTSMLRQMGQSIVHLSTHAVQGTLDDAALLITDQTGASVGWKAILQIGSNASQDPLGANATIISWKAPSNTGTKMPTATGGVDFLVGQFSGSAFRSTGFDLRGDGVGYWFNAKVSTTASGVGLDIPLQVGAYTSVSSGGTGNTINDLYIDNATVPGIWKATAVSGGIVSVAALVGGKAPYSSTAPATLTLTNLNSDRTATFAVNVTWTAQNTLTLLSSGGSLQTGSGTWSANASVATALSSVGPVGSHTTVQEWFTVKNASGTVRYIPAF